ncbi:MULTISPECIES: hypothetical protein [unclassified Streptomyces]|uniref:hypothetical protein n=1 Tax=unclassified Streptomyces TaxID=2593676 RepID=UPI002255CFDF|nr:MULTISPECIES: hypothetical protein [unclassified Streptomyces]MCX5333475.1 hypothetical protein [Streptomyces sp. NBC_00140]MCX5362945.1 hypothetical protein [Streptomyces sp. NBC_00124]
MRVLVEARDDSLAENDTGKKLLAAARAELDSAYKLLDFEEHHRKPLGSHITAAQIHLSAARLLWVRSFLSSPQDIKPYLPSLLAVVKEHLSSGDERRKSVENVLRHNSLGDADVVRITEAVEAAQAVSLREELRAGSFVRIVWVVAGFLFVLALSIGALSAAWPKAVPLCFNPPKSMEALAVESGSPVKYEVVCPTGTDPSPPSPDLDVNFERTAKGRDYFVVEVAGLVAAGLASASALRKIRGTSTSYGVPVALAALKLPAGALTAVGGLLLMRGGFVPGLSALDSSAQIIAWAIIFGYSQELFTKFVDRRGQAVLEEVRGPGDPPPGARRRGDSPGGSSPGSRAAAIT